MYLLDTNIILEIILNPENHLIAEDILNRSDLELFISDFSLYLIGIFLIRQKKFSALSDILDDIKICGISIIRLTTDDLKRVSQTCYQMNLDFDDGYQYTIAEKHHLNLISFDHHFDKTPLGRVKPQDLRSS